MEWICTSDRQRLIRHEDRLSCATCGQERPCVGQSPIFASSADDELRVHAPSPALDELLGLMRGRALDDVELLFCKRHDCSRQSFTTDWKFFLPFSANDRVLEVGAGFGEDTRFLSARADSVVSLVPTVLGAEILGRRVRDERLENVAVAVLPHLRRLPLESGSVGAMAIDDAAVRAFGLSEDDLPAAVAEWRRVVRADGSVLVGLKNPLRGLERLRPALLANDARPTLNRWIKLASAGEAPKRIRLHPLMRAMRRAGFGDPLILAPLPDVTKIDIVLPIEDGAVVRYCFGNLLRRNSPLNRIIIALVKAGTHMRLIGKLVPYYFLVFGRTNGPG